MKRDDLGLGRSASGSGKTRDSELAKVPPRASHKKVEETGLVLATGNLVDGPDHTHQKITSRSPKPRTRASHRQQLATSTARTRRVYATTGSGSDARMPMIQMSI